MISDIQKFLLRNILGLNDELTADAWRKTKQRKSLEYHVAFIKGLFSSERMEGKPFCKVSVLITRRRDASVTHGFSPDSCALFGCYSRYQLVLIGDLKRPRRPEISEV